MAGGYYHGVYGQKILTQKEELALGLTYGDTYNGFARLEVWDNYKRKRLSQSDKERIVAYMKERYQHWLNRINESGNII